MDHVSFVYLDDANRTLLPARTVFSVGTSLHWTKPSTTLSVRAQNLLDTQATDVLSRPLPGFNLLASFAIEEAL
jgi:outer membrane receptor protein involved in Fe transport